MIDIFQKYLRNLFKDVPIDVYVVLSCCLCLGIVLIFTIQGIKKGWRKVLGLILVEYVALLFFTTVFGRTHGNIPKFNFTPFWSYHEILNGKENLIPEIIMNIVVFVPIGVLIGLSLCRPSWRGVFLVSICLSSSIELLQLILHKGFSEIDDIIHNTFGGIIGLGLLKVIKNINCRRKIDTIV